MYWDFAVETARLPGWAKKLGIDLAKLTVGL
jgi:hypothetical protein